MIPYAAATYGQFTLDYIEVTGPVVRVGLFTTNRAPIVMTPDTEDDVYAEILEASSTLAQTEGIPIDWRVNGDDVELMFER